MNTHKNESPTTGPLSRRGYATVIGAVICALSGFSAVILSIFHATIFFASFTAFTRNFVYISGGIYSATASVLIVIHISRLYDVYQRYKLSKHWDLSVVENSRKTLLVLGLCGVELYAISMWLYDLDVLNLVVAISVFIMLISIVLGDFGLSRRK